MSSTRRISIFGIALGPGQTKVPNAAGEFLESFHNPKRKLPLRSTSEVQQPHWTLNPDR
jgi:hypothetical protein